MTLACFLQQGLSRITFPVSGGKQILQPHQQFLTVRCTGLVRPCGAIALSNHIDLI
jgi:hypothetical protein